MPLSPGDSAATKSKNIAEMVHAGHPRAQAVAAALSEARRTRKHGGHVSATKFHVGPIHSPVSGRTDHLPIHVLSGSYVIPADIISAMGQGNTMSGFKVAKDIFGASFYGHHSAGSGTPYGGDGMPYGGTRVGHFSGGGVNPNLVPIIAAGGEFVMHPDDVARIGHGSLDDGHRVMDHFVKGYRTKTIKVLQRLPGPKKD